MSKQLTPQFHSIERQFSSCMSHIIWLVPNNLFKTQCTLYVPPCLKLTISTFGPQCILCVLYGSQYKQRLFLYTALTDWFIKPKQSVYCAVRTEYNSLEQTLSGETKSSSAGQEIPQNRIELGGSLLHSQKPNDPLLISI
jgi:hypothetical protein